MITIPTKILARDKMLEAKGVNPTLTRKAKAVLNDLRSQGLPAVVVEVIRSKSRALLMKATGKSLNGLKSSHVIGRAIDIAFWDGKKISWSVPDIYWDKLGSSAHSHNMIWGGDWTKLVDKNHIELR